MKKAFSLLEIIFVIAITSLILSYLIKNSILFVDKANITKIQTELSLIRSAININKNDRILKGLKAYPSYLDEASNNIANEKLFGGTLGDKLLENPLISTSKAEKQIGNFFKSSQNKYGVYISKDEFVEFEYDNKKGTFNCISSNELCRKVD